MKPNSSSDSESGDSSGDFIPGLPNEVVQLCLLYLPLPHFSLALSVSSAWNHTLSNPTFLQSKLSLSFSRPHLFVLASDRHVHHLQWSALDPRFHRWFLLPPMPIDGERLCGASLACAADGQWGEIYVMRGTGRGEMNNSTVVYNVANNSWRVGRGMRRGRRISRQRRSGGDSRQAATVGSPRWSSTIQ